MLLCILASVFGLVLGVRLHSQLFLAIRGKKPNYSREPRHVVYMPFIMVSLDNYLILRQCFQNVKSSTNFVKLIPSTKYLPCIYETLDFTDGGFNTDEIRIDNFTLELHGVSKNKYVEILYRIHFPNLLTFVTFL